jgi:hypothetical protein
LNLDFVPPDLEFVPLDLDFVSKNLDIVPVRLDLLHRAGARLLSGPGCESGPRQACLLILAVEPKAARRARAAFLFDCFRQTGARPRPMLC